MDAHYRRTLASGVWLRRAVQRSVDLEDFDVVHVTPHLAAAGLLSIPGRPKLSVALDATIRQSKASRRGISSDEADLRHAPLRNIERRILDSAASVVCLSSWARDAVAVETSRTDGLVVVPPAVAPISAGSRDRGIGSAASSKRVQIVFVGNAWERKGGPELLAVHQRDLADLADLHVCSADAPIGSELRNVHWHGPVPRQRLLEEVLPAMDVFAMPTHSDMSPWAVVEALGAGLPVVTTNVGGIPEMVTHGVSGLLSEPGDVAALAVNLGSVVQDGSLRDRLAAGAQAAALGRLSLGAMRESMVSAWSSVC